MRVKTNLTEKFLPDRGDLHPIVHSNGSGKANLLAWAEHCESALADALTALHYAGAPHQRDYYIEGPEAWAKAQKGFADRVKAVAEVHDFYKDLIDYLHTVKG